MGFQQTPLAELIEPMAWFCAFESNCRDFDHLPFSLFPHRGLEDLKDVLPSLSHRHIFFGWGWLQLPCGNRPCAISSDSFTECFAILKNFGTNLT